MRQKHGLAFSLITSALRKLVAADSARGLDTRIIFLDDNRSMRHTGAAPVADPLNARENKRAIDAIFNAYQPDYILLLGAPDIIPHQNLTNPLVHLDLDPSIPSDLPYACEAGFSQDPARFIGPTRVVGRLPDVHGAPSAEYLCGLLKTASEWKTSSDRSADYFSITAQVWAASTRASLQQLFGGSGDMLISPPAGPHFTPQQWAPNVHFINCHGAPVSSEFFGERNGDYPVAMQAAQVLSAECSAAVVSVECCYGADLFEAPLHPTGERGIAEAYLNRGAYAYFGSTTISYGSASKTIAADIIAAAFLNRVVAGASSGRAVLEARQNYASATTDWSPFDLKTFAQFLLLGDPSVTPFSATTSADAIITKSSVESKSSLPAPSAARKDRRRALFSRGLHLSSSTPRVAKLAVGDTVAVPTAIRRLAEEQGFAVEQAMVFESSMPSERAKTLVPSSATRTWVAEPATFYVFQRQRERQGDRAVHIDALITKSVAGQVVTVDILMSR